MPADLEKDKAVVVGTKSIDNDPSTTKTTTASQEEIQEVRSLDDALKTLQPTPAAKEKPFVLRVIRFMQDQWFLITLGILIAIASQHQVPPEHQKLKSTVVSYVCVSVIFFITGCTLKTQTLIDNYARWKIHLFVQLQCFFVTSLIMYGIVSAAATNKHFMDPGLLGKFSFPPL